MQIFLRLMPPRRRLFVRRRRIAHLCCTKAPLFIMTEPKTVPAPAPYDGEMIPEDLAVEMRRLAHDLSMHWRSSSRQATCSAPSI